MVTVYIIFVALNAATNYKNFSYTDQYISKYVHFLNYYNTKRYRNYHFTNDISLNVQLFSLNAQLLLEIYDISINMVETVFIFIETNVTFAVCYNHALVDLINTNA